MFLKRKISKDLINKIVPNAALLIMKFFEENGFKILFVGGISRNFFTHEADFVKDIDLSTSAKPHEILELLRRSNILNKFKLVLIEDNAYKYGTVKIACKQYSIDITSFRKDVACFGRQSEVVFTNNIEEDSIRRDFSMNAIYVDLSGNIYDFHNGIEDIENKKINFIKDSETRIKEDFLRILRLFRFNAKLNFCLSEKDLHLCSQYKEKILDLSNERIISEFTKIVASKYSQNAFKIMSNAGISELFFQKKELIEIENEYIDFLSKSAYDKFDSLILASFLIKNKIDIDLSKIKFSNYTKKICKINKLLEFNNFDIFNSNSDELKFFLIKEYLNNNKDVYYISYLNINIDKNFWNDLISDRYKLPYSLDKILEKISINSKKDIKNIKRLYIDFVLRENFRVVQIEEIARFIDSSI